MILENNIDEDLNIPDVQSFNVCWDLLKHIA